MERTRLFPVIVLLSLVTVEYGRGPVHENMDFAADFTLTDLCGLIPEQAIASAIRTARTLTTAAVAG